MHKPSNYGTGIVVMNNYLLEKPSQNAIGQQTKESGYDR